MNDEKKPEQKPEQKPAWYDLVNSEDDPEGSKKPYEEVPYEGTHAW